jgi:hypothetical protein
MPFLAIVTTTLVFFRTRSVSSSSSSVPQTYKISPKILLFARNYVLGITLLTGFSHPRVLTYLQSIFQLDTSRISISDLV